MVSFITVLYSDVLFVMYRIWSSLVFDGFYKLYGCCMQFDIMPVYYSVMHVTCFMVLVNCLVNACYLSRCSSCFVF